MGWICGQTDEWKEACVDGPVNGWDDWMKGWMNAYNGEFTID